ncbi:ribosomal-protein-alanine N-acetyltransferase [Sporosarcina luteola]|nr:ribosomal-protein-alanine N-acetyltransferase [Sporosarcina luteola]
MRLHTDRLLLIACNETSVLAAVEAGYEMGPHISTHLTVLKEEPSLLGWGAWLVTCQATGEVIGDIGFKGRPDANGEVEVGYGILPAAQNKGFATESVRAVTQWAFSTAAVNQIIAECNADNFSSIRVLEKLGMEQVGLQDGLLKWRLRKK